MSKLQPDLSSRDIKDMIEQLDHNKNGKVEYSEFFNMMANQMKKPPVNNRRLELEKAFKKFDSNGDGFIQVSELGLVMKTFSGRNYSQKEINDMIEEADVNSDGKVSFDEFCIMTKNSF